ncbi:hypothetical protein [Anaerococcus sp.]|jgi:hypothetical protein|uniref:hypothetical protein n=1 Tax=Anaerococcus sp. TaxID=1872515 RepID=UPI00258FD5E6|nr:hypothetical protein [Anaerococcus sp.]MDU3211843.1 hypothetical protein [Anaerococcus sp.]
MNEINKSEFKDTEFVKKLVSRYNINALLFALGIFIIIVAIIPYFFIKNENITNKILPSLIILAVGVILIVTGKIRMGKIQENVDGKYTVAAFEYIDLQRKSYNKIFRKDLVIGILLMILIPFIYFLVTNNANYMANKTAKYLYSILLLLLGVALFMITYSKGKKDAYKILG